MHYVVVVGGIGAGKTTLIEALEKELNKAHGGIKTVFEPIKDWKKILELFYSDPKRWAYFFQTKVFVDYVKRIKEAIKTNPKTLISERSIECQPLFWDIQPKLPMENETYYDWFHLWKTHIPEPTHYIFLDTLNTRVLMDRIQVRDRAGEEHISNSYEQKIMDAHREKYTKEKYGDKLTILDAEASVEENLKILMKNKKLFI